MDDATELIAGRFEVTGSPVQVQYARRALVRSIYFGRRWSATPQGDGGVHEQPLLEDEAELWLRGTDRQTGAPVLVDPLLPVYAWTSTLHAQALARRVMGLDPPFTVRVLHVGPQVVFEDPGPAPPRPTLPPQDAASCALDACETLALLHDAGCAGPGGHVYFDSFHLRVVKRGDGWGIQWLVPGMPELDSLVRLRAAREGIEAGPSDPVVHDLLEVVHFFFSLCPAALTGKLAGDAHHPERAEALRPLRRIHGGDAEGRPAEVASLARLLLPLAPPSPERTARIAALPAVPVPAPLKHDWDVVIADGEALLATCEEDWKGYVRLPLAAAYHQRASKAFARGAKDVALRDAERALALDAHIPYGTTVAVILDALGRREEARREIDAALARATAPERRVEHAAVEGIAQPLRDAELARVHTVRGMFALQDGALAEAERDLQRAMELCPTALAAHALGAAQTSLGDMEGAAQAEARSIELDPGCARFRWALVITLRKLGRHAEAREQAARILERWPESPEHQRRFTQLFGI